MAGQHTSGDPRGVRKVARGTVVIVSASMGAGHNVVSHELARRLRTRGVATVVLDLVDLLPWRLGYLVRRSYEAQLRRAPRSYGWLYAAQDRFRPVVWGHRRFAALAVRRLRRALPADTVAVVATTPDAAQTVGRWRRRAGLPTPAMVAVTDFAPHRSWVAKGIDSYAVVHALTAEGLRARGAEDVLVAGPVVRPPFTMHLGDRPLADLRRGLRRELGLPPDSPVALLAGGSWGTGQIETTARTLRDSGVAVPLVLCGRNDQLRARLHASGIRALGWRDDMADVMRACDVLIENAGGQTCQEAFAVGLPVLTVAPLPGHGLDNARTMQCAGVTDCVVDPATLAERVAQSLSLAGRHQRTAAADLFVEDTADVLMHSIRQPVPVQALPHRHRLGLVAAGGVAASLVVGVIGLPAAAAREAGVHEHLQCADSCVSIVVRLPKQAPLDAALLRKVSAMDAVAAVSHREAAQLAGLAPGLSLVEPADEMLGGFDLDPGGHHRHRLVLLSAKHPTALQVGLAYINNAVPWRPARVVTKPTDVHALPTSGILLVDLRRDTNDEATAVLALLDRQLTVQHLQVHPLEQALPVTSGASTA